METLSLNLIPKGISPICHCSQYDTGRVIRFNLLNGNLPYTIQSGDTVTLNVRKPDDTIVTASVSVTQGNSYVDIVTTEQMCACAGKNLCELRIANNNDDIGTLNFVMAVERDVLADGIPSESVIEDLDARIAEAIGDDYYNKTEVDELLDEKAEIDDTTSSDETTWSSEKISNEISGASTNVTVTPIVTSGTDIATITVDSVPTTIKAPTQTSEIDDTTTASNKTWSSEKIASEISGSSTNPFVPYPLLNETNYGGDKETTRIYDRDITAVKNKVTIRGVSASSTYREIELYPKIVGGSVNFEFIDIPNLSRNSRIKLSVHCKAETYNGANNINPDFVRFYTKSTSDELTYLSVTMYPSQTGKFETYAEVIVPSDNAMYVNKNFAIAIYSRNAAWNSDYEFAVEVIPEKESEIDDTSSSASTTWSSNKISTEIANKTEIDDTSTASNKTWSAQKINGLLILDVTNVEV